MRLARCCRVIALLGAFAVSEYCWAAPGKEICIYPGSDGKPRQAQSIRDIPERLRSMAQCYSLNPDSQQLADPGQVKLKGNVREEYITSSLGRISLRWPRTAEVLFGRTPQRAMTDAANTISRVLRMAGFPLEIQNISLEWQVVFMDEDLPEKQIPAYLVSNCHPAWMTPPANLYIVAQRVVAGCSGNRPTGQHQVADAELSQVLIHEMGHAIEYVLLGQAGGVDRMRAEGFASWFEQYASDYSSVNRKGAAKEFYTALARQAFRSSPDSFVFQGSAHDYARASMFFHAIVNKRGIRGLMDVYQYMKLNSADFFSAVQSKMGWNQAQLNAEAQRMVN